MSKATTRTVIERLWWIGERLRLGEAINARHVIRRFEVSRKTVVRDVEFLRDRLGWPVEFDQSCSTYRLNGPPPAHLI